MARIEINDLSINSELDEQDARSSRGGTNHSGGANFLFGDGSVRFANQKTEAAYDPGFLGGVYVAAADISG